MTFITPKVGILVNIETLSQGVRPVINQVSMLSFSLDDPETIVREVNNNFPMQPQLDLIPPRQITADTFGFWLRRSDEARRKMVESTEGDFDDLAALVRHTAREFGFMIEGLEDGEYEVWAGRAGKITALETLFADVGVEVPWDTKQIRDLRTLMALAMIAEADVPYAEDRIPHQARSDALFSIACYAEANRQLRHR